MLVIAECHACKQSPIAKKIWLSIHLRNFGSHMTVHPSVSPQGNQDEISHFLASVGACNMILHILVVVNKLSAVKTRYLLTSIIWPCCGLQCWPIEVTLFFKFSADKLLLFSWSQAQFQVDFFANMITSLLFEENYILIYRGFAFNLG